MQSKLVVKIETSSQNKSTPPWMSISRRGKHSVESQFFVLLGYDERSFSQLSKSDQEEATETIGEALRLLVSFEYIPTDAFAIEDFFEKKLITFENGIHELYNPPLPIQGIIGITYENKVLFATSGDMLALQITSASVQNIADPGGSRDLLHFETFHSGALTAQSYLLFTPRSMGALLKSDELKQLTFSHKEDRKLGYLESVWEKRCPEKNCITAVLLGAKPKILRSTESTATSISTLLNTESKTEELLSPPLLRPLFKGLQAGWVKIFQSIRKIALAYKTSKTSTRNEKVKPQPVKTQKNLTHYVMKVSQWSAQTFQHKPAIAKIKRGHLIENFNQLPLKSKLLLFFLLTFVFVFTQSVLLTLRHKKISEIEQTIQTELTTIQALIDQSNASLIYRDEEKSLVSLQEAKTRISALPEFQLNLMKNAGLRSLRNFNTIITSKDIKTLEDSLKPLREKLQHVVSIENPTKVSDALADAKGMIFLNGRIIAYNGSSIVVDGTKKDLNVPISLVLPNSENNELLIISGNLAYAYKYIENVLGASILLQGSPVSGVLYGQRLYTLNPEQNQIYKYDNTAGGFNAGASWIKDGSSVDNGQAIAVDGSVYVLTKNGVVDEFLRGSKRGLSLKTIDPPLADCSRCRLWTTDTSANLYILDPVVNRLAVFNKDNGILKAQYQSAAFTELKDFSIDEKSKKAYLLNGDGIVSISLSQ